MEEADALSDKVYIIDQGRIIASGSLFWIFIWPIILTLMVAYVFIPPSAGQPVTLDLGVVNLDHSESPFNGTIFIDVLKEIEYNGTKLFNVEIYDN